MTDPDEFGKNSVEIELGKSNKKIFFQVSLKTEKILVDLKCLPQTAFFCAMCDGISLWQIKCGKNAKILRSFVDMEWCLNQWGGSKILIDALKETKQKILEDLPRLKEKYQLVCDELAKIRDE